MSALSPDARSLLAAHGITAPESPMATSGFSGARHTSVVQDGQRYILKRLRFDDDWLMRLTHDARYREAEFAASTLSGRLPAGVAVPTLGAAIDGDGRVILMRDIGASLLGDGRRLAPDELDAILRRVAGLHAAFWRDPMADAGISWCSVRDRLALIGPETGDMLVTESRDFGLARGWQAFDRLAPAPLVALIRRLFEDMTPLTSALGALPSTLLHGDLKVSNFGLEGETLSLLDWALVMRGPVAVDIAWLLAVNSSVLPWTLDETVERYLSHLEAALSPEEFATLRWPQQRAAMMLCGVVYYGWGKALDAEDGRPEELRWWCDGATRAASLLGL